MQIVNTLQYTTVLKFSSPKNLHVLNYMETSSISFVPRITIDVQMRNHGSVYLLLYFAIACNLHNIAYLLK